MCLHSFPTRRSSDLDCLKEWCDREDRDHQDRRRQKQPPGEILAEMLARSRQRGVRVPWSPWGERMCAHDVRSRSEEHTSELQSRFDIVCRLLLEKKK